jgi:hypothetical protein
MQWQRELIERLAAAVPGGYFALGEAASEPTALAGLALHAHGLEASAQLAADWLAERQEPDGSVGVTALRPAPRWPTSLAILLWQALSNAERFGRAIARAVDWALNDRGETHAQRPFVGHDSTLVGWSWAANTHSWLEPTAMFLLALKAVGQAQHARTREAVQLLVDRLLPTGGCNYGNTFVLGQQLLPHVEPTGLVLMALGDEQIADPRIERSLQYLERELSADTTTASLCYGLLGLAAHDRRIANQGNLLETAYRRTVHRDASPYKLALIALAIAEPNPLDR